MMSDWEFHDITLPVFGSDTIEATPRITAGTAFGIGGGYFLTAAHVVQTVAELGLVLSVGAFMKPDKPDSLGKWGKAKVTSCELFEDYDLALMECGEFPHTVLPWLTEPVDMLTTVISGGYPYAHEAEKQILYHRAFSGSISAHRHYLGLGAQPPVYELTFAAPRGLSGAPVLVRGLLNPPHVVGYVIKNAKSGMLVSTDTESIKEEDKTIIVERYEFLTYGVAVCSHSVLDVASEMIGRTIGAHLALLNLAGRLPRPPA